MQTNSFFVCPKRDYFRAVEDVKKNDQKEETRQERKINWQVLLSLVYSCENPLASA